MAPFFRQKSADSYDTQNLRQDRFCVGFPPHVFPAEGAQGAPAGPWGESWPDFWRQMPLLRSLWAAFWTLTGGAGHILRSDLALRCFESHHGFGPASLFRRLSAYSLPKWCAKFRQGTLLCRLFGLQTLPFA